MFSSSKILKIVLKISDLLPFDIEKPVIWKLNPMIQSWVYLPQMVEQGKTIFKSFSVCQNIFPWVK